MNARQPHISKATRTPKHVTTWPAHKETQRPTLAPLDATGIPDVEWLTPEGRPFSAKDWNDPGTRTLLAVFYDPGEYDAVASRAAVLINAGEGTIVCALPGLRTNHVWALAIDSAGPDLHPLSSRLNVTRSPAARSRSSSSSRRAK
jgi:pullulanase/glycogen debranching enzyme